MYVRREGRILLQCLCHPVHPFAPSLKFRQELSAVLLRLHDS